MKSMSSSDAAALAREEVCPASEFEPSGLKKATKSVLGYAQSLLPNRVYELLYKFSFGLYKAGLRLLYFRHVLYQALFGTHAGRVRVQLVHRVMPYSLVGSSGLEVTYDATRAVIDQGVPGDFVECGVARGGCSALMATVAQTGPEVRRMWLFDSFQGLPDPTADDFDASNSLTGDHVRPLPRGSCLGTQGEVEDLLFSKFHLHCESVSLVKGWFQDTLPHSRQQISEIALLRIDGDWYESTLCCLHNCYDLVSPGGRVIIDDYGTCFGCKKAVHEFLNQKGIAVKLIPDGRGGVVFEKPA